MSRFKKSIVTVFAFVAVLTIVPTAVLAAQANARPAKGPVAGNVFGSLVAISATGATVNTRLGDVNVVFKPLVAYVSYDQAAALAGIQVGDQVNAIGTYADGTLHVDRFRYATVAFPVTDLRQFDGRYSASTSTTLTLQLKKSVLIKFNLDANTKYFRHGHRLLGPPAFRANEHIIVWAWQYSDQSRLAAKVNVLP